MLGLVEQFGDRPAPRYDDHRGDVAQLGGDGLVQRGLVGFLAPGAVGTGAEDHGVVGLVRSGDVHFVDQGVPGQKTPGRGTAVNDL